MGVDSTGRASDVLHGVDAFRWTRIAAPPRTARGAPSPVDLGDLGGRLLQPGPGRRRARAPARPRPRARRTRAAPPRRRARSRRGRRRRSARRAPRAVPRATSSCSFVSSRQTAARRSAPNAVARSASASAMRCGDSKKTSVRGSAASAFSAAAGPCAAGSPRSTKRSVGSPDTASAVSTARRSGQRGDRHAGRGRGRHEREARIADTVGIPASDSTSTSAVARELDDLGRLRGLVVLVQRDQPRAVLDAERAHQLDGGAGVFGRDHLGVRQRLDRAAARRRRGCRWASPRG